MTRSDAIDWDALRCRHGGELHHARAPVVAIVHVPEGCVCFRDPIQALCRQHFDRLRDGGSIPVRIIVSRVDEDEEQP